MTNNRIILLAIACLVLAGIRVSQGANAYCSIATCAASSNTLCKYTNATWGTACLPAYANQSSVSSAEITTILSVHNTYRRKVAQGLETQGAPGPQLAASNMRQLVWDSELAVMAQTHAQQCVFQHDTCRDVSRFQVGQNIYITYNSALQSSANWTAAVSWWYGEVSYMTSSYVKSFPQTLSPTITSTSPNYYSTVYHYTQLVWATTYTVGCGVASFKSTGTYPYQRFYVCNYGPAGNSYTSAVYSQGTAGSACPSGTTNSNGLCA